MKAEDFLDDQEPPPSAEGFLDAPEAPTAASSMPKDAQQSLARPAWEADRSQLDQRRRNRFAENDPRRVDRPWQPGPGQSVLDRPQALDYGNLLDQQGRTRAEMAALEAEPGANRSPQRQAADAKQAALESRPLQQAKPLELTNRITTGIRESVSNPAARGVIAGVSELGKVGTGAVRLAADLVGANDVAGFAAGAEHRAGAISEGATQDLKGNDKLVADVFSSVVNSLPSMALGTVGGPALRTLFAQSAMQEYGAGRDAGFGVDESLQRAAIFGFAEALGERFGFPQQIKLLKSLGKQLPTDQLSKTLGEMIAKEVPGEQLTTAIQFMADKIGPAALRPNAGIADYLKAAGETLKVTLAQSALMGGGPAALGVTRNELARADALRGSPTEAFFRPQSAMPPTQAKSEAVKRFDELAAAHGINSAAVQRAKAATADMPADEVPGFLARMTDALTKRRLVAKPIDHQSLQELGQALGDKPAEPPSDKASQAVDNIESILRRGGALPDSEAGRSPAATGGADGQTQEEAQGLLKKDAPADVTTAGALDYTGLDEAAQPRKVEGEPINRKWTAFAPESGTLSIPREQMPQVDAEHRGALVNFLAARGVAADQETVAADSLKPTQREFEPGKVKAMAEGGGSKRRILVSSDDHILDGHHQWLAKREAGQPVDIIRLDAPVQDLLRLAHQFPSSTTARGPKAPAPQEAANAKPELPDPADVAAGGPDEPGAAGARSGGDQRPDAAVAVGRDGPAPAPAPSGRETGPVGDGGGPDAALTPAAPKPRILGSYGRSPAGATQIELRPNEDGTLTPYTGKYAMVEHESGEPIRVPAGASDAEVVDAIRASGAVTNRDRFFGVKVDKADKSSAAPADAGESGQTGGDGAAQPGAATQPDDAQDAQARRAELVQRATWLRKLIKCLDS